MSGGVIAAGGITGLVWTPPGGAISDYVARWGVVAYWTLDAAGTADSVGVNTLTASASAPTSGAGLAANTGTAAQFTAASSQQFTRADTAALSFGADQEFWGAAWGLMDSKPGANMGIIHKGSGTGITTNEIRLEWIQSSDRLRAVMGDAAGAASTVVVANNYGVPALATPFFALFWMDKVADTFSIRIDHGTVDSITTAGRTPPDTAGTFRLGSTNNSQFWDGRIDAVVIGKDPPGGIAGVINEISSRLWQGGSGREHPWL